tara:strand:+ start:516 stop:1403 length:888 start_codon:yes stop_codon:yes gene_type:complete
MKLQIRNKTIRLPRFRVPKVGIEVRLPELSLAIPRLITRVTIGGQFKKMAGISITIAALVVVTAVTFAVIGVEQAKTFPMAAEYTMDERTTSVPIGLDPASDSPVTQTLKLNIGGARINNIIIDDINVGNATITQSLKTTTGGATVFIECDEVLIDNVVAKKLTLGVSEIYNLVIKDNKADGNSFSPTVANGIVDITVTSDRGAVDLPAITGSDYDRIWIDAATASTCAKLTIKNVNSYTGVIDLSNIKAGTLTIQNSTFGSGTGINSADFIVAATTKISTSTLTNNAEQAISVK